MCCIYFYYLFTRPNRVSSYPAEKMRKGLSTNYCALKDRQNKFVVQYMQLFYQFQIVNIILLFHRKLRDMNARWHIHLFDTYHGSFVYNIPERHLNMWLN